MSVKKRRGGRMREAEGKVRFDEKMWDALGKKMNELWIQIHF